MPYVLIILIFNCNIHVTFTGLVAFDQYVLYIIVVVCDARLCVIFSIFDTLGFDTLDINDLCSCLVSKFVGVNNID